MTSKRKCKVCFGGYSFLSNDLVQSGERPPRDWKCPVCDTYHTGDGQLSSEVIEEHKRRHKVIDDRYRHLYGWDEDLFGPED